MLPPDAFLSGDPGELTLRTTDGEVIPASIRTIGNHTVFAPDETVPEGLDLELEYSALCPQSGPYEFEQQTFAFSTFEAMPLTLGTPALTLYEQGVRTTGGATSHAFVRVRYDSPAWGASAVHLIDFHATVDGHQHRFESTDVSGGYVEIHASCPLDPSTVGSIYCSDDWGFGPGLHHVEVWSSVVGVSDLQNAELDVNLVCPELPGDVTTTGEAGASNAGGDDASEGTSHAAAGGGCSFSRPSRRAPFASWLGVLGAFAVLARRKRARRSAT